jgi:hypothetical protein
MNRQQFIEYVKSPGSLDAISATQLEHLIREYPYCQTADILYTLNLFKENHFKFNDQLKLTSAYACDRKVLKNLVNDLRTTEKATQSDVKSIPVFKLRSTDTIRPETVEKNLTELFDQLKVEVDGIKQKPPVSIKKDVYSSLHQLAEKLEHLLNELDTPDSIRLKKQDSDVAVSRDYNMEHLEKIKDAESGKLANNDLIDKFIKDEPKIEPEEKSPFFDATELARKSIIDNESVVSETLAEIYYRQGKLSKAINIYKKLSLVNPEKSSFFAAQIEKIRQELK